MFVRFKCRYPAKCGSSAPRSHCHKAVLSPVTLTFELSGRPRPPLGTGEHGASTMNHGPRERVVRHYRHMPVELARQLPWH